MITHLFLTFVIFGAVFQTVAIADPTWEALPEIYPGDLSYIRLETASPVVIQSATITVSNATSGVSRWRAVPFGTDQLCGIFTTTLLLVSTGDVPTTAFSTSGTYFVMVEMSSQTNHFQQVVRNFQTQTDEQAFIHLPDGLILKTVLLGKAAECTTQDNQAVQQFLTNYPSAYYASYARTYLGSCRLYTELAGNRDDPFHEPDPTHAITDLEAIQGAEGLCRGKILSDLGYAYWKRHDLAHAKPLLEAVIGDYPATPWAAAAREMLGLKIDGMVAWYPLNEGQGLVTTNLVCNGLSGQLVGTPIPVWVSGVEGNALQSDGNGHVVVPTNSSLGALTNRVTLAAWVKASPTNSGPVIARTAVGGTTGSFSLALTNGHAAFKLFLQGTSTQAISTNALPDSLWHYVAGVYDGQGLRVYLDGAEVGSVLATGTVDVVDEPLFVGHNADGTGFVGAIDDVRIYARALSAQDITDLFNVDTDNDGLSNVAEINTHGTNPTSADTDGDGVIDGEEVTYFQTNPLDYYNEVLPSVSVVSGNNQTGQTNSFLANPLVVSVADTNAQTLVNAPVSFTISQGAGEFSISTNGSPLVTTLDLRSGTNGQVQAFFKLPSTVNSTNQISATVTSGTNTVSVTFTEFTSGD